MHRNPNRTLQGLAIGVGATALVALFASLIGVPMWAVVFLAAIIVIGSLFGPTVNP